MAKKWAVIDASDNVLTASDKRYADAFHGGYARAKADEGEYNFLSDGLALLNDNVYDHVGDFDAGGLARVETGGRVNFVTLDGDTLTADGFTYATPFVGNYSIVRQDDGTFNFLTREGATLMTSGYVTLTPFVRGYARGRDSEGKMHVIGMDGAVVGDGYDNIGAMSPEGIAATTTVSTDTEGNSSYTYGYMDTDGAVIADGFAEAHAFVGSRARVRKETGGQMYIIDTSGSIVGDGHDYIRDYVGDSAAVQDGDVWRVVDKDGAVMGSADGYNAVGEPLFGMRRVTTGGGTVNFVNAGGTEVFSEPYDDARQYTAKGYVAVKRDGLWGYADRDGNETTGTLWYEAVTDMRGSTAEGLRDGIWYKIDASGKMLAVSRPAE